MFIEVIAKNNFENSIYMNDTILKFGYPNNLLKEFEHWVVLLRPKQITIGCILLACKEDAKSLGEVSLEAYKELKTITTEIEGTLNRLFNMNKINYLALMMKDKYVHFHVLPRYSSICEFNNLIFEDANWPKAPDLSLTTYLKGSDLEDLRNYLISLWPI